MGNLPSKEGALKTGETVAQENPQQEFARHLQGLLEISNLVGSVMNLDDILNKIVALTAQMLGAPSCSIYLTSNEELSLRASIGLGQSSAHETRPLSPGRDLHSIVVETNQQIAVPDARLDPRVEPVSDPFGKPYRSYICSPLRIQEDVIGAMTARRYDAHEFSAEEATLFETVCKQVAIVIEKSVMYYAKIEADRLAAVSISLSEIAHYIKNLLQGMKGGMYFVDMGLKRGQLDMARKGWDVLRRGNKKIASLVENMLNFSREMKMDFQKHNVNSLIFDILHQIDDSAIERGVAILPETHRDLPLVEMDYDRIYDALLNLIGNAIDAIPSDKDDGLVIVKTRKSEDKKHVEIAVVDNGCGMSGDVQKKMYNLFFSTKGERGSGIGLAVTRKIIEQHNGRILLESEIGKGTTFKVQLPILQPLVEHLAEHAQADEMQ